MFCPSIRALRSHCNSTPTRNTMLQSSKAEQGRLRCIALSEAARFTIRDRVAIMASLARSGCLVAMSPPVSLLRIAPRNVAIVSPEWQPGPADPDWDGPAAHSQHGDTPEL